jgi:hypothetical protein
MSGNGQRDYESVPCASELAARDQLPREIQCNRVINSKLLAAENKSNELPARNEKPRNGSGGKPSRGQLESARRMKAKAPAEP